MTLEINYIARKHETIKKLENFINTQSYDKRDVIVLDFDKLVDQLIVKHGSPKKSKRLTIFQILKKLNNDNFNKLSVPEQMNGEILEKMVEWQEEYQDVEWEDFRDHYFKCTECGGYDKEQCICYAR